MQYVSDSRSSDAHFSTKCGMFLMTCGTAMTVNNRAEILSVRLLKWQVVEHIAELLQWPRMDNPNTLCGCCSYFELFIRLVIAFFI